ncbi:MAG: magnesium chelatase ATPase subunit I [Gemmatimonas sp.]|uniref:magnesium chelatase ATPase subunit I n=1 Tax=Gemmatimonas sp. TaxID=1962908 RepID=UPI00391F9436
MRPVYPFSAIVGQEEMKLALLLVAIDPTIGGVMVFGDRGTGKSTAVRALAGLLPPMKVVQGCKYGCDPADKGARCDDCRDRLAAGQHPRAVLAPVPVVDLPLGATEDRVVGALDLERALTTGEKAFEPGLLARAHRGFLYVDEVNLLEDHQVDLLLEAAATGENFVEREGVSVRHPSRFVLVGSGNPEEGELRPQLLDRFGLAVDVKTPAAIGSRIEVIKRRDAYDRDPEAFLTHWQKADAKVRRSLEKARTRLETLTVPDAILERAAALCSALGTDGLRGELTLLRTTRALAAYEGADAVTLDHLRRIAPMALRHRLRRNVLDDAGSTTRVARAIEDLWTDGAVAP